MADVGEMVAQLISAGCAPEAAAKIVAAAYVAGVNASNYRNVDEQAERRRAADRVRSKARRDAEKSAESADRPQTTQTKTDEQGSLSPVPPSSPPTPPNNPLTPFPSNSEANASGAEAPLDPSQPEREFFARGKQILGKSSGGQLAKLLSACGRNVALARSKIELAATKQNAAEFVAGIIRAGPTGQSFAKPLTAHQAERQTARNILDDLDAFAASCDSRQDDLGFLPGNPSQRPQGLRSGSGGDVISLPAIGRQTRG